MPAGGFPGVAEPRAERSRRSRSWTASAHRRRAANADGEPERHSHDGGLRLCEARRVHAGADICPGHSQGNRRRGQSSFHLAFAQGPQMVGWAARSARKIFATGSRMWRNNSHLSPSGLPISMLPQGEGPRFEVLDETTVRYTWAHPNPLFLPDLAGAEPALHLSPLSLSKAISPKICRKRRFGHSRKTSETAELGVSS